MVEKRKRTVAVRESNPSKHRSVTPAPAASTPEESTSIPEVPTSFTREGPLPVVPQRQPDELPLNEFKSVAESKVMAESLIRSQRKWVDGDIFDKFWIKPLKSRKLDPADLEKNPSKDCMTRLGNCSMSSMPHKFEIKLFGVLEPVKKPPPPTQPQPQQPVQRPNNAPKPGSTPNNGQPSGAAVQTPSAHQVIQQGIVLAPEPVRTQSIPATATPVRQDQRPTGNPGTSSQLRTSSQQTYHNPQQHPPQQDPPRMVHTAVPPRPDPVIQALAIRAASDPDLKALMRIVASGMATTEQLKIFQGHIDALTGVTLTGVANCQPIPNGTPRPPAPGSPGAPVTSHTVQAPHQQMHPQYQQQQNRHHHPRQPQYQQNQAQPQNHPNNQQFAHYPSQHAPKHIPAAHQVQAAPKPRPFPQTPKQEITSVVFEFVDPYSQGDRFLFPKHTILEYMKGGTMARASFIIVRKPVDDLDEYYQPMTVVLESATPKTLEVLQKVVASQEATCKHMKEIMATMKRAEDNFLAFRLRREPGEAIPDKPEIHAKVEATSRAMREHRVRRGTSTPTHDPKSSTGTPQVASSRPRVKTVKKALPREPTAQTSIASSSSSAIRTPVLKLPRTPRLPKPPRSRKGRIADPTKSCHICQTSKTSLWRKADIEGENVTVCNACGIKWKTNAQKAAQAAAQVASGQVPPKDEASSSLGMTDVPQLQYAAESVSSDTSGQQVHPDTHQVTGIITVSGVPRTYSPPHLQHIANAPAHQPHLSQQSASPQLSLLERSAEQVEQPVMGSAGQSERQAFPPVEQAQHGLVALPT